MNQPNCPSRDKLQGFVSGAIPEEQAEAVAEHLETCVECEATVEQIESHCDSLVANLRRHPPLEDEIDSPECQEALAQAEAILTPSSAAEAPAPVEKGPTSDQRLLGEYQLLEKLGQGGMGAVYKARHTKLKRVVAIKVLPKEKIPNQRTVTRFEREMEAVGQLDHPNIVRAHDAREIDGMHFLVMEYVEGQDLSAVVQRGPLAVADACEVIRQAALGLQYAHEHRLVHRDIKPSNLMLSFPPSPSGRGAGGEGVIKILDLGLALLSSPETGKEELTSEGQPMGTADYMAPEQTTDSHAVDIRADVYSLGCTLYKLLTGRAPFYGEKYKTAVQKMMAHLVEQAPRVESLRSEVPPKLAAIIHRMLAKKPEDRFATPGEVAAALEPFAVSSDLRRLPRGTEAADPPQADPGQTGTLPHVSSASGDAGHRTPRAGREAAGSPARRPPRRVLAIAGALGGALVLLGIVIILNGRRIEVPEGSDVRINEKGEVSIKLPGEGKASSSRPLAGEGAWQPGSAEDALPGIIARPAKIPGIHRWQVETVERRAGRLPGGRPPGVVWSPDGRVCAVPSGNTLRLLNAENLKTDRILLGARLNASFPSWTPDGQSLVAMDWWDHQSPVGVLRLWKSDGSPRSTTPLKVRLSHLSPDGTMIAGVNTGDLLIHSLDGKKSCLVPDHNGVLGWNADGSWLLAGSGEWWYGRHGSVRLVRSDGTLGPQLEDDCKSACWSPDGRQVACGRMDGKISLWRIDGTAGPVLEGHAGVVFAVSWSPDGRWVASSGADKMVRLWEPQGKPGPVLAGHQDTVYNLAWSRDSQLLVSQAGNNPCVRATRVWQISPQPKEVAAVDHLDGRGISMAPDGKKVAFWGLERDGDKLGLLRLTDYAVQWIPRVTSRLGFVAWNSAGTCLASRGDDGTVRVWRRDGVLFSTTTGCEGAAWQPDGRLAVLRQDGVHFQRIPAVAERSLPSIPGRGTWNVWAGSWSQDGAVVAVAKGKTVLLYGADGAELHALEDHAANVGRVAMSSDGQLIASHGQDGEVRIRKRDGTLLTSFKAASGDTRQLAFSPDGKRLGAASYDNLEIFACDGTKLGSIHVQFVNFTWGADSATVFTFNWGVIRRFQIDGKEKPLDLTENYDVSNADCAVKGGDLAMGCENGVLRVWDVEANCPKWSAILFTDGTHVSFTPAGQIIDGDPAVCGRQLAYVIQRTPDGPQELWSYQQFQDYLKKQGMDLKVSSHSG